MLIDADEHQAKTGVRIVDLDRNQITKIYNQMVEELADANDVAVILRIDGFDVAMKCSRLSHSDADDECLLF